MLRSELPIDQIERFLAESGLKDGVNRFGFYHVLRWAFVELKLLNMTLQVVTWQNDRFKVQYILIYHFCDLLNSLLTGMVFSLDGYDDPVIENVEHLECLAGDLMQDQNRPRE